MTIAKPEDFIAQVTKDIESQKPIHKSLNGEVVELNEADYKLLIDDTVNGLVNAANNGWKLARQDEYPSEVQQIENLWDDINEGFFGEKAKESSWFKSIQEIKNKYPKPE